MLSTRKRGPLARPSCEWVLTPKADPTLGARIARQRRLDGFGHGLLLHANCCRRCRVHVLKGARLLNALGRSIRRSTRDVVQARLRRCGARMSGTNVAAAFVSRPSPDGCIRNQNQLLIRLHRHRHHLHRGYEVQRRFYSLQLATTSRCWYWQPTRRAQTCHRCRLHLISAPQMRAVAPGRVLDQVRGVKRCFPDRWGRFWQ
jgi:hypothetical protein